MTGVSLDWRPPAPEGEGEPAPRVRLEAPDAEGLAGRARSAGHALHEECLAEGGGLAGCLACGHPELYTQRDFPRPDGIAIVVLAAVLAPATHYLSLAAAALLDLALYHLSGQVVRCYVCGASHRGFPPHPRHPAFDREIDERLRYGERAVMGRPMRPGGTADAPDPEH